MTNWPRINTDETQNLTNRPSPAGMYEHEELTRQIIGAAIEVHRELGPGFLERIYESALLHELEFLGVQATSQAEIPVSYKGRFVGIYYGDVIVEGKVLCEIKAADGIAPGHQAQLLHYLKATGLKVGLLLNFGARRLQVKRLVY